MQVFSSKMESAPAEAALEAKSSSEVEGTTTTARPITAALDEKDKDLGTSFNTIPNTFIATAVAPEALRSAARLPTHLRTEAQKCLYLFGKLRWQSSGLNEVERHVLLNRLAKYEEQQCRYDEVCEVFREDLGQSYQIFPSDAWFKYVRTF